MKYKLLSLVLTCLPQTGMQDKLKLYYSIDYWTTILKLVRKCTMKPIHLKGQV